MPQFQLFESDHVSLFPLPLKRVLLHPMASSSYQSFTPQSPHICPHRNMITCELNTFSLPPENLLSLCELPLPIRL